MSGKQVNMRHARVMKPLSSATISTQGSRMRLVFVDQHTKIRASHPPSTYLF